MNHEQSPGRELKSCGVFVTRGVPLREFLLMKHPSRWDLPKGHIDPGESEVECAMRELVEETGITADDIKLDPGFRFTLEYPVVSKRTGGERWLKSLVVFLGRLSRVVEITPTEHESFAWFEWRPPHRIQEQTIDPLLKAVEEYLQQNRPPHVD